MIQKEEKRKNKLTRAQKIGQYLRSKIGLERITPLWIEISLHIRLACIQAWTLSYFIIRLNFKLSLFLLTFDTTKNSCAFNDQGQSIYYTSFNNALLQVFHNPQVIVLMYQEEMFIQIPQHH